MSGKTEKAPNNIWKLLSPVVVLCAICLVITAALAATNQVTAPIIAAAEAAKRDAALLEVLPAGDSFEDVAVELDNLNSAKRAANGAGYVFDINTTGFGGAINLMVGISSDGAITGSKVITHGETEGIGSKVVADNSPYQQQLIGMTDTSGIVATSGASVSSGAMTAAMKTAFNAYTLATGGTVELPKELTADEAMALTLPDADSLESVSVDLAGVAEAKKAANGSGYVFLVNTSGFGGQFQVAIGISSSGAVTGTRVLANNETEGIGSNVVSDGSPFQQQLIGMTDTSGIVATSGASLSSKGMTDAVQIAFDAYTLLSGGTVAVHYADKPATLTDDVLAQYYPGATFTEVPGGMVSAGGTVVYGAQQGMESQVAVAVFFDGSGAILGVHIDASNETAGLGTRCGESGFTQRFVGVKSGSEVDALAGATVTSTAAKGAVDQAIANYQSVKGAA